MSNSIKTPDDGQRNCPKHVEFYSKNKFEKLMHLVGFIIRKINTQNLKKPHSKWHSCHYILYCVCVCVCARPTVSIDANYAMCSASFHITHV